MYSSILKYFLSQRQLELVKHRARICIPFKEPGNRFQAWQAGTTTLFVVPARQAAKAGGSIPGLLKRFTNTRSVLDQL
jgi:hypothetical protein